MKDKKYILRLKKLIINWNKTAVLHQKRRRRRAASNSQQIVDDDDDGGATQLWRRKTNPGASPIPAGKGLPGLGFVLEKKPDNYSYRLSYHLKNEWFLEKKCMNLWLMGACNQVMGDEVFFFFIHVQKIASGIDEKQG